MLIIVIMHMRKNHTLRPNTAFDLNDMVRHEEEHWSRVFTDEISKKLQQHPDFSSYWWEDYYAKIKVYIESFLPEGATIIEFGSGSGKATLLLNSTYKKDLLDVSKSALKYARKLARKLDSKYVRYIEADAFNNQLQKGGYDLCWNIGVLEHYPEKEAIRFITEMMDLTKSGGNIIVGVPNFASLPILKAKLLNFRVFSKIKGYRLDSEINYKKHDLVYLMENAACRAHRQIIFTETFRVGNPLITESPDLFVKLIGKPINYLLPRNRFLLMIRMIIK